MWKFLRLNDSSYVSYGMGWDTKTHAPGQRSAGHSGGMLTTFRKFADADITVILLTNGFKQRFNPDNFAAALASIWAPQILGLQKAPCVVDDLKGAQF